MNLIMKYISSLWWPFLSELCILINFEINKLSMQDVCPINLVLNLKFLSYEPSLMALAPTSLL